MTKAPKMSITIHDIDQFKAHMRLDRLQRYLNVTEEYLQKAKEDSKVRADDEAKKLPLSPQRQQEYYDLLLTHYWPSEFPRILRNSFLVSAISLLEYELERICRWLEREKLTQSSWNDIKGNFFERFKKYWKEASLPSFCKDCKDQDWQEINSYSLVRHCIVHNRNLIERFKREKALRPYVTEKNIISQDTREVALTEQFCQEVVITMHSFLGKVYEAISTTKKKSRTK